MTQNDKILFHLKKKKKINPIEALNDYGCFRLSARILDLRKEGHNIKTNFVTNKKTNKTYAEYIYKEGV